jgi:hypothetical protein
VWAKRLEYTHAIREEIGGGTPEIAILVSRQVAVELGPEGDDDIAKVLTGDLVLELATYEAEGLDLGPCQVRSDDLEDLDGNLRHGPRHWTGN